MKLYQPQGYTDEDIKRAIVLLGSHMFHATPPSFNVNPGPVDSDHLDAPF